jgi:uncharacterized membrane protein YfcA
MTAGKLSIRWRIFFWILPAAAGGFLGAKLLSRLPNRLLKRIFAALVTVAGLRMLFG